MTNINGVNTAKSNASLVKSGDTGSQITLTLENVENAAPRDIQWIRLIKDNEYTAVDDYTVMLNKVMIRLPEVPIGEYSMELKDDRGRIYPAEGTLNLKIIDSSKGGAEAYFTSYRDEIIDDVTPIIEGYIDDNPENFRGPRGHTTSTAPKVYTREEYDNLDSYDDNTLYFIEDGE